MRILFGLLFISILVFSCNSNDKSPDVSNVKIEITTQRFEKDLFTLDTTNFKLNFDKLLAAYPSFGENFIYTILGADPKWTPDSTAAYAKMFVSLHRSVYDSAMVLYNNFSPYEKDIKKGLQFVKHYFPNYRVQDKIITYIGPLDGFGDIITDDAIIVGLHLHLGKDFALYKSEQVQQTYPDYLTSRFEPAYIAVNSLKNIMADMYPEKLEEKSLVQQMVEKGKRLYLLNKILPGQEHYILIGYSAAQMKSAYDNEKIIWDLFVQNNLLQTVDENVIKNYIGESPKTQELGEASPGNIGAFAGWQIVKKYMQKNPEITLPQLMATDAETLFQEAKYKP